MHFQFKIQKLLPAFLAAVIVLQPLSAAPAYAAAAVNGMPLSLAASVESVTNKTVTPGLTETRFSYIGKDKYRNTCFMLSYKAGDPRVSLVAGTPHDSEKIGLSTVRNQANAVIAEGKQVVAAINSDMYNMNTGDPWGVVVKNGKEIHPYAPVRTWWKFFGLKRNGAPIYGDRTVYEQNKSDIWQAMGIHSVLVDDSKVVNTDHSAIPAPRVAVGVRSDYTIFFLMVDGRQSPYSHGLTLDGIAQMMKDLGAVWAGNMDGGGSATCLTKAENSSALKVQNRPSDGSERAVANSWLFVLDAPQGGDMASADVKAAYDYYTPGSLIQFSALARSNDGRPAEMASSGLSWSLAAGSDGIINSRGTVTAGASTGTVEAQLNLDGQVMGTKMVHVVQPDSLARKSADMRVLPGSTLNLGITASWQGHPVLINPADLSYEIPAGLGSVDGNGVFHASNTAASGNITVQLKGTGETVRIHICVGEPEIMESCEWLTNDRVAMNKWAASANYRDLAVNYGSMTSLVHSGKYAMRVSFDFRKAKETGNLAVNFGPRCARSSSGSAAALGMWVNGSACRGDSLWGCVYNSRGKKVYISMPGTVNWSGWKYIEMSIPQNEKGPFSIRSDSISIVAAGKNACRKGYAVVDDIQFTYNRNNVDAAAPITDEISVDGKTYSNYKADVEIRCHDAGTNGVTSGINWNSVKVCVDGVNYINAQGYACDKNGTVAISGKSWSAGRHRLDVSLEDNTGNCCGKTVFFTVTD